MFFFQTRLKKIKSSKKGFSLIEIAVTAAIGALLLALLTKWVMLLTSTSTANLTTSASQRQAAVLDQSLQDFFNNAKVCPVGALSVPWTDIEQNSVQFYTLGTSPATIGNTTVIGQYSSNLIAATITSSNVCNVPAAKFTTDSNGVLSQSANSFANYTNLADDASPLTANGAALPIFSLSFSKQPTSSTQYTGSCLASNSANCLYDTVRVRLKLGGTVGPNGETTSSILFDRTYKVNLSESSLSLN